MLGAYLKKAEKTNYIIEHPEKFGQLPIGDRGLYYDSIYLKKALNILHSKMSLYSSSFFSEYYNLILYLSGEGDINDPVVSDKFETKFNNLFTILSIDSLAGSSIVDDFNNDGYLDIFVSSINKNLMLFHGQKDGTYDDVSKVTGVHRMLGGLSISHADYNNDGWLDIYVSRGAWLDNSGKIQNSLLKNINGVFYDITFSSGMFTKYPNQVAVWGDVNNDGCVDLFIGNESYYSELYENQCDESFINKAQQYGVNVINFVKGAAWGDINNDGLLDLFISSFGKRNQLFLNQGKNQPMKLLSFANVDLPIFSYSTWFFDFNNDGFEDLFVSYYDLNHQQFLSTKNMDVSNVSGIVYENKMTNTFQPIAYTGSINTMGANFGDLNGDGFLDIYLSKSAPDLFFKSVNQVYINNGGNQLKQPSSQFGLADIQSGNAVAFADVDYDGDLDIYLVNGGWFPVDHSFNRLFINESPRNHWIGLKLVGINTNRSAIGVRIKLTVLTKDGSYRRIFRTVSSGGSFGSSPFFEIISFSVDKFVDLEVYWPVSKSRYVYDKLSDGESYEIYENGLIKKIKQPLH